MTTYQDADLVIGQPDFTSYADNAGGATVPTARSLYYPDGVCADGAILYVVDEGNDRVLRWNPSPSGNYTDAQTILGKSSFTDGMDAVGNTQTNLRGSRCAAAAGKLVVADHTSRRVLVWNSVASSNQAADLVLGSTSFTAYNGGATTQSQFKSPYAVWTDGTRLAVADADNHRVMIWNTFPTANGQNADLVLGQTSFTTGIASTTASGLRGPSGIYSDGTRLIVGDQNNHRVLIWNTWPTTNGQAADVVIGQQDMTTNTPGTTASTLMSPQGVTVVDDTLFVADTGNDRVVAFTPVPTASGVAATYVLGQADLTTGGNSPVATKASLNDPVQVGLVGNRLFVVDRAHNRVVGFALNR